MCNKETIESFNNKRRKLVNNYCDYCKDEAEKDMSSSKQAKYLMKQITDFDDFVLRFFDLKYSTDKSTYQR